MYQASSAFHQAVANANPQLALMIFGDTVFTNEDIKVDSGIELNDYFCTEEDLSIGAALSNELRFTLFNDYGYLNNYAFGEFTATIGVKLSESVAVQRNKIYVESASNTWTVSLDGHTLSRNGTPVGTQPAQATVCIVIKDGTVYCFGESNYGIAYDDATGAVKQAGISTHMKRKMATHPGIGVFYNSSTRLLKIHDGDVTTTYEFVPLGVFDAERPNVPNRIEIAFTCYDRMQRLDEDMPDAATLGITYPTTIGTLYQKICQHYSIPYRTTTFINSTAEIREEPKAFETATSRQVMAWIAEAAASNARLDRDGYMVLDWIRSTGQEMDENDYMEFDPYWYETEVIGKLHNRDTQGSTEKTRGNGAVGYLIQDNPLLKGVS